MKKLKLKNEGLGSRRVLPDNKLSPNKASQQSANAKTRPETSSKSAGKKITTVVEEAESSMDIDDIAGALESMPATQRTLQKSQND